MHIKPWSDVFVNVISPGQSRMDAGWFAGLDIVEGMSLGRESRHAVMLSMVGCNQKGCQNAIDMAYVCTTYNVKVWGDDASD